MQKKYYMNKDITKDYKVNEIQIDYNRIFMLSDLHFGVRANSIEWLENHLSFFHDFYIPWLKKNLKKGDVLFILGDWFDNRQLLDINIMNKSIDLAFDLGEILPVYFMTGNHDIYKKNDTDVNSLAAFRFIPNVTIFEDPIIITNSKTKIFIMPWVGNGKDEEAYVKANKTDYVFAHTDIAGFQYDNGMNIQKGARIIAIEGIRRLYSGHIHKRQDNEKSVYIGSPYSTKRSDIGNIKGVYVLDPDKNEHLFQENTLSPIFQRIPLDILMEKTLEETYKLLENNYTDIIVPDKYINLFNLTRFIDLLKNCKYRRVETRGEKNKIDESIGQIIEGSDIKDILTLLESNIDDQEHTMEMLVKLKIINREYYDKASKDEINI